MIDIFGFGSIQARHKDFRCDIARRPGFELFSSLPPDSLPYIHGSSESTTSLDNVRLTGLFLNKLVVMTTLTGKAKNPRRTNALHSPGEKKKWWGIRSRECVFDITAACSRMRHAPRKKQAVRDLIYMFCGYMDACLLCKHLSSIDMATFPLSFPESINA